MREIKVGLVGFGISGRVFHEPIITSVDGFRLHKVFERNPCNINYLKEKVSEDKITSNIDDIFEDDSIELVVLAIPNVFHFDLAKRALEKGKNVLVEKPFTVTSEEADKLIEISKKVGKLITINHNRRYDSDFKTVKKIIENNLLGDLVEYEAHFDRFRNNIKENAWRESYQPGSGLLYDLGSHLIDQAQVLFGVPKEIFAVLEIQRKDGKAIDNFEVILKYESLKVTLKAGMLVRELGPHFNLLGTKGSFVKYGMDIQEETLRKGINPKDLEIWGAEPEILWGKINTEINGIHITGKVESELGDYRELYKNLYKAILGEENLNVTPEQARNTIKIIELAEISSREKKWIKFE
jgi:predicted dehydrogenase